MVRDTGIRLLVCRGRDYSSSEVFNRLEREAKVEIAAHLRLSEGRFHIEALIHGGARGADEGAARWGESEGLKVIAFPADWKAHGKSAGPIRNRRMITEGKPDVVIAFPGGRGTADMIRAAEEHGIPVIRVDHEGAAS